MTDEELLERARGGGDGAAFLLLYERHRAPVFRFACRMLDATATAEDVTHDCFLGLLRSPHHFDPARGTKLRTYLFAAARNLAHKHLRRTSGEAPLDVSDADARMPASSPHAGPLGKLLDEELAREVRRAVGELPPLQREAVVLFEYEELPLAEIAVIVGADVGTVKSRLFRARAGLRQSLASYVRGGESRAAAREVCR